MASVSIGHTRRSSPFVVAPSFLRVDTGTTFSPDVELSFLPEIVSQLQSSKDDSDTAQAVINRLFVECNRLRHHLPSDEWKLCVEKIRRSEVLQLVHQDAFTNRAFTKPRGYAGDAVMMDMIYGREEGWDAPEMSGIGRQVYEYTTTAAASAGVRARREFIAELLDEVLTSNQSSEVLAVASGHLREASMSSAVRRRRFERFVALDADSKSLDEVQHSFGRYGVTTHLADIRKMLTGKLDLGSFDLIYSTGLYDYLNEKTAQRLTYHLFSMLRPGGKLVIANFLPFINDIGYMEACMDWFLVYRDRFDMLGLTKMIHQELMLDMRVTTEENQNIIFLEITRA
ncbi:MAG: class I SAM-dependent methyltransferase [Pirellulaceae bacterium]|nr:class I SAM-dependent methyltransferase [Pirellulaceae bacterium]